MALMRSGVRIPSAPPESTVDKTSLRMDTFSAFIPAVGASCGIDWTRGVREQLNGYPMDRREIESHLREIGKGCFVNYYLNLNQLSIPDEALAEFMTEQEGWVYSSTLHIRVKRSREIIRAGQGKFALLICASSSGLPRDIRDKAWELAHPEDED